LGFALGVDRLGEDTDPILIAICQVYIRNSDRKVSEIKF
jgi:hypothetical protein